MTCHKVKTSYARRHKLTTAAKSTAIFEFKTSLLKIPASILLRNATSKYGILGNSCEGFWHSLQEFPSVWIRISESRHEIRL